MSSIDIASLFAGMVKAELSRPEREWKNNETTLVCPICTGSPIGRTGSSCSHPLRPWVDKTPVGPCGEGHASCGLFCVFECCEHVIEYRLRFHKGDVFVEWRHARPIEVCT